MPLLSLPDECFSNILFFLDNKSLYKCLFVNRHYCRLSIPIIWEDPFTMPYTNKKNSLINTLIACLNEDEISSLIPYLINFNNQPSLFEYGKFIRKIDHDYCVRNVVSWLKPSIRYQDCRIQKLINAIYHMIMREGSNIKEFVMIVNWIHYIDLPKFSIFTTYKPGIMNLKSLDVEIYLDLIGDDRKYHQNTIDFLCLVSKLCNGIINCELCFSKLNSELTKSFLDIIESQPLERILMDIDDYNHIRIENEYVKKIIYALEFRSETLKELLFRSLNFKIIDLSFMSKLESLERLEFIQCDGFVSQSYDALFEKKFHLKELKLWHNDEDNFYDIELNSTSITSIGEMINSFCSKSLLKLSLNIITPETIKAIKESCPNINSLHIKICSSQFLDLIIPIICKLSLLKILKIEIGDEFYCDDQLVKIFSDHLIFVEDLLLDFHVNLLSFKYFTNNCKANLKKLIIYCDEVLREDYLTCVNNFQKVHNSLKILGIKKVSVDWTNDELKIINSLKDQGVGIYSSDALNIK